MLEKFKAICLISLIIVIAVVILKIGFALLGLIFSVIEILAVIGLIYLIIDHFKNKK